MIDENQKKFVRVFGAILPLLGSLGSFPRAFWLATFLGAGALFVIYLFILLKPLFPEKLFRGAVMLFVAMLFQISMLLSHLSPLWVVSFILLLDWNDFNPKHLAPRPLPPLVRVGIFWLGLISLGAAREILGRDLGVQIFQQPAGLLGALAIFSWIILSSEKPLAPLWMKKRKKK